MATTKRDIWITNLRVIPVLPAGFIEALIKQRKPVAVTSDKGYLFFNDGFVDQCEGKVTHDYDYDDNVYVSLTVSRVYNYVCLLLRMCYG